jgi:hypothetical protein
LVVLHLLASAGAADFRSGLVAYQRGDYATALREWRPVAEAGDATAQLYLGLMYEAGHGVPVDLLEARRWFERAAAAFPEGDERKRAQAGRDRVAAVVAAAPVEAALVGAWQTTAPDPVSGGALERVWEIALSGQFAMTTTRKGKDGALAGRSVERGQFRAKSGKWSYTLPNQAFEGSYRVLDKDAFETTGPLGITRWTRVGATPPATTPVTGRVLFEDDFRSSRRWPERTDQYCKARYGEGGYVIGPAAKSPCISFQRIALPVQARIELEARLHQGAVTGAWGIAFGLKDGAGGFTMGVTGDGYYRMTNPGGGFVIPWTREEALKTGLGAVNRVAIEVRGQAVTVFINGKRVGAAEITQEGTGFFGLYTGLEGMEIVATLVKVTDLAPASAAAPTGPPTSIAGRVLFDDDFKRSRTWTAVSGCRITLDGAGLDVEHVATQGLCEVVIYAAGPTERSLRIDMTLSLRQGPLDHPYGLLFGWAPDGRVSYGLKVTGDGSYKLSFWDGSRYQDLIPYVADPVVRKGLNQTMHLTVEIRGRTLTVFVNGKALGPVAAPTAVTGRVGLTLNAREMRAVVSRLTVVELPP